MNGRPSCIRVYAYARATMGDKRHSQSCQTMVQKGLKHLWLENQRHRMSEGSKRERVKPILKSCDNRRLNQTMIHCTVSLFPNFLDLISLSFLASVVSLLGFFCCSEVSSKPRVIWDLIVFFHFGLCDPECVSECGTEI